MKKKTTKPPFAKTGARLPEPELTLSRRAAQVIRGGKQPQTGTPRCPDSEPDASLVKTDRSTETSPPPSSPAVADATPAGKDNGTDTDRRSGETPLSTLLRKSIDHEVKVQSGKIVPTQEQEAILKQATFMKRGFLVIEAGAGTGKTSTLKMLEERLPGNGQYTAFNTSLVAESKAKFRRAACNTTHSLAFRAVGKAYAHRLGGGRIKSDVVAGILGLGDFMVTIPMPGVPGKEDGKPREVEKCLAAGWLAGQVLGAIRRFCQSADPEVTADHFKYIDGIDLPCSDGRRTYANNERVRGYLLPFAKKAWKDLSSTDGQLPFAHDHYVKIWQLSKPVISADYILLDESQDTAPVMLDVLEQQKALIILVGDSAQQIYEWRGAVNAMASFPDAPRLFLSQSFRFGQAVADVANSILDSLCEPTELRLKGLPSIRSEVKPLEQPTAVLCRTNAVAVATVLNAMTAGKQPHLIGGGSDVLAFVRAAKDLQDGRPTGHPELACFRSWGEVVEYSKLDEGEDLKLMVKLIEEFGPDEIIKALQDMPKEADADLVVSTAHKSKGREWETVQLASDFPTNSKSSDSDRKLLYVAATRAKMVLDISHCPFFTGEDALEVVRSNRPEGSQSVLPPAPSTPPPPQSFTWSKGKDGGWLIRGPKGEEGQSVEVVRRDGSKSRKTLGKVIWENEEVALYQV